MNLIITSPHSLFSEAGRSIIEQFHPRLLLVSRTADYEIDNRVSSLVNKFSRQANWETQPTF